MYSKKEYPNQINNSIHLQNAHIQFIKNANTNALKRKHIFWIVVFPFLVLERKEDLTEFQTIYSLFNTIPIAKVLFSYI